MADKIFEKMSADSYFQMGYFYQNSGDLHSAAECYLRSIENGPTAEAHTFLAWVLNLMGELDSAIEECKNALELDPTFGNALNDLGVYLTEKRQIKKATSYLKRAIKTKNYETPEFPHYNLARIYAHDDLILSAVKELKKSLKINPRFDAAKNLLDQLESQIH